MKKFFDAIAKLFKNDPDRIGRDGATPLQRAILDHDFARAQKVLAAGADVNLCGNFNGAPLHLALEHDRHAISVLLLDAGADIGLRDGRGRTPLHIAGAWQQEYITLRLLHMKADPNMRDNEGKTPLHVLSTSKPAMIATFVRHGASVNAQDDMGDTPLHVFFEKTYMADRLLDCGADPNIRNNAGITPFMLMLENDALVQNTGMMRAMLRAGADLSATTKNGENLLFRLVRLESLPLFTEVMAGTNLAQKDAEGNNILHHALRAQNLFVLQNLLPHAGLLLGDENSEGMTPLADLIGRVRRLPAIYSFDRFENVCRMTLRHGADVNTPDDSGATLAHYAARHERYDFLADLIHAKADLNVRNHYGVAPVHIAIEKKNMELLDMLLDAGADPNMPDERGWTILDRLAERNDRDSPVVQRLIVAGGQYKKQLPLNPDLMSHRPVTIHKPGGQIFPRPKKPGDPGVNI